MGDGWGAGGTGLIKHLVVSQLLVNPVSTCLWLSHSCHIGQPVAHLSPERPSGLGVSDQGPGSPSPQLCAPAATQRCPGSGRPAGRLGMKCTCESRGRGAAAQRPPPDIRLSPGVRPRGCLRASVSPKLLFPASRPPAPRAELHKEQLRCRPDTCATGTIGVPSPG